MSILSILSPATLMAPTFEFNVFKKFPKLRSNNTSYMKSSGISIQSIHPNSDIEFGKRNGIAFCFIKSYK